MPTRSANAYVLSTVMHGTAAALLLFLAFGVSQHPSEKSRVIELVAGPVKIHASVRLTPVGFLAIGAMVTGILLAASSVVWSATSVARRRAGRRERSD